MTQHVDDLMDHMAAEHAKLGADLTAHKDMVEEKLAAPMDPGTLVGGAENVGSQVGGAVAGVVEGVGSTAADVVGTVGTVADAAHNAIDNFFHNLRNRLGI